jgi:serine/threonine-protein kinase
VPVTTPVGTDAINAAVSSIQELYAALSAKDYASAASHYGSMAADQFDPAFFNQFERVTVANLHQTSNTGSMLNFEGVVTFVYRNGDVQTETRSFTVDTRTTPARITSSEFGRVLQAR